MKVFLYVIYVILGFCPLLSLNTKAIYAVTTEMWIDSQHSDFAKGKLENISLHSSGDLTLSPHIQKLEEIDAEYVWCLAANEKGLILAGTGGPGSIFKITQNGDVVEFFKTSELHVQTIAMDNAGNIYAGTLPHGRIYRITPEGEGEIFCEVPGPYVWDLILDKDGCLFAATGNNGIIYKISNEGIPSIYFDSPCSNILDLTIDTENNIYASCEPEGYIYKISANGKVSLLYDADESEIHCLDFDNKNGVLYAGTASGTPLSIPSSRAPRQPKLRLPSLIEGFPLESSSFLLNDDILNGNQIGLPPLEEDHDKGNIRNLPIASKRNFVYSIDSNGRVKEALMAKKSFVLCLKVDENNDVLVGTGNKAKLFKINEDKGDCLLHDFSESQILDILLLKDGSKYIATGNNAGIYKMPGGYSNRGTYESDVYDAEYPASWGAISWKSMIPPHTEIKISTRSGNSNRPDTTWSDWSVEYHYNNNKIKSPSARFIQYRAEMVTYFSSTTPSLYSVCIAYLPQNQQPMINDIEINAFKSPSKKKAENKSSKTDQAPFSKDVKTDSIEVPENDKSKKTISWSSYDPNEDRLTFDLEYKSDYEEEWKELERSIKEEKFDWNTSGIPDGYYQVKIMANDSLDNPTELALKEETISRSFLIDNTKPLILNVKKSNEANNILVISGIARDEMCNISKIQYSINSEDWISVFPVDNIFDSKEEPFQIRSSSASLKDRSMKIKAEDSEGNVSNTKIVFVP